MTVLTFPLTWGIDGLSGPVGGSWVETLHFRPLLTTRKGGKKWPEMTLLGLP